MSKPENNPDIKVIKTASCDTLSGKSKLTYQIGCTPDKQIHLRISKNSGGGFFSDEWIALNAVLDALQKLPKDTGISSYYLAHLFTGKSVNTPSFHLAALKHLKLIRPLPNNRRHHELVDPRPFLGQVEKLMSSKGTARKTSTKKTGGRTGVRKKAESRRKKATA